MKHYIRIQADTNDADYVESFHQITKEEIELIIPVIEEIKKVKNHNFLNRECIRRDLGEKEPYDYYVKECGVPGLNFEIFSGFVPYGIHTIEEIEIYDVLDSRTLI